MAGVWVGLWCLETTTHTFVALMMSRRCSSRPPAALSPSSSQSESRFPAASASQSWLDKGFVKRLASLGTEAQRIRLQNADRVWEKTVFGLESVRHDVVRGPSNLVVGLRVRQEPMSPPRHAREPVETTRSTFSDTRQATTRTSENWNRGVAFSVCSQHAHHSNKRN